MKKINEIKNFRFRPFTYPNAPSEEVQREAYLSGIGKPFKVGSVEPLWVKKLINRREWDSHYSHYSSYCRLGSVGGMKDEKGDVRGGKISIGFCVVSDSGVPAGCELMTDEEVMSVDQYRRSSKVAPYPLTSVRIKVQEELAF